MISQIDKAATLLFHQGALGDWVLTFPLLRRLGSTVAITHPSMARLASDLIDHVIAGNIDQAEMGLLFVADGADQLRRSGRTPFAAAGKIISFVSNGADRWAHNIRQLAPQADHFFVEPRPAPGWPDHVCRWHEHQLQEQGMTLSPARTAPVKRDGGPIVIHPGSGSSGKCWPAERFQKLAQSLVKAGRRVNVIWGEVEAETWAPSRLHAWASAFEGRRIDSLEELRSQLERASIYVGNDSGPTHLAATLGINTVALFGPSDPRQWAPRGPAVKVLRPAQPRDMAWLEVEAVLLAISGPDSVS